LDDARFMDSFELSLIIIVKEFFRFIGIEEKTSFFYEFISLLP